MRTPLVRPSERASTTVTVARAAPDTACRRLSFRPAPPGSLPWRCGGNSPMPQDQPEARRYDTGLPTRGCSRAIRATLPSPRRRRQQLVGATRSYPRWDPGYRGSERQAGDLSSERRGRARGRMPESKRDSSAADEDHRRPDCGHVRWRGGRSRATLLRGHALVASQSVGSQSGVKGARRASRSDMPSTPAGGPEIGGAEREWPAAIHVRRTPRRCIDGSNQRTHRCAVNDHRSANQRGH
jgi:hypothetical protein